MWDQCATVNTMETEAKRCEIDGCEKPSRAKSGGLCSLHYQRWLAHGAVGQAAPLKGVARGRVCTVEGCSAPVRCKGLCSAHYTRLRKSDTCPTCGEPKVVTSALCQSCHFKELDKAVMSTKACTGCARELPPESFGYRMVSGSGRYKLRSRCRECSNAEHRDRMRHARSTPEGRAKINENKAKSYRKQSPEIKQLRSIRNSAKRYGLDPDEITREWDKAGHRCAICSRPPAENRRLHLDHCHATGRFRGFLCTNCNTGIGQLQDSPEILRAAITYLTSS